MLKLLTLSFLFLPPAVVPGLSVREQAATSLYDAAPRKALALSSEQERALDAALKANDERRDALAKAGSSSDAALLASDRRFAAAVDHVLTAPQRKALLLRAIKARGVASLADPEVAARVGLKGAELSRVQAAVKTMNDRDDALSDELANAASKLPEPKTAEENRDYDAKRAALDKAAAPRIKARADARKAEEKALLTSLSPSVRKAYAALIR